jgi:hypothetical protein
MTDACVGVGKARLVVRDWWSKGVAEFRQSEI